MGAKRKRGDEITIKKYIKGNKEEVRRDYNTKKNMNKKSTNCIKVVTHNTRGYDELSEHDTRNLIKSQCPDVVGILETHLRMEDGREPEMEGYSSVEVRRSDLAGDKKGGGILVFVKQTENVKYEEKKFRIRRQGNQLVQKERVWITARVKGGGKFAFGFVYIAQDTGDDRFGDWNDSMYSVLSEEVKELRKQGFKIHLSGDFNAWVGAGPRGIKGNDKRTNRNGERLLAFLDNTEMMHMNGEDCCSGMFTRHDKRSATVLDYVCVSKEDQGRVKRVFIDENSVLGGNSDHVYVITSLETGYESGAIEQKGEACVPRWNITEGTDWQQFKVVLDRELVKVPKETENDVDKFGESVVKSIVSALEETVGKKKRMEKSAKKRYPASVLKEFSENRKKLSNWREARSKMSRDPTEENRRELDLKELDMTSSKEKMEQTLETFWIKTRTKIFEEMAQKTMRANKEFWRYVVSKSHKPTGFTQLMDPSTGEVVSDQEKMKSVVETFLKGLFHGSFERSEGRKVTNEDLEERLEDEEQVASKSLDDAFEESEVNEVIKKLENCKAMGTDEIPNEAIKNGTVLLVQKLTQLFNMIQKTGKCPEVLKTGRIVLVPKPGDSADMTNYRPLTVISVVSGLFSKVLNERLTREVERRGLLGEIQQGFRKGRSGEDNIFVLNTILMMCSAKKWKPNLAFVDIKKAYDSVSRQILWQKLTKLGLGRMFIGSLQAIYQDDRFITSVNGEKTSEIFLGRGLRQGCSLSPMLFALYISEWGEELESSEEGYKVGNLVVSALLFADDLLLCARTPAGLKRLLNISERHTQTLELLISEKKSMVLSPSFDSWDLHNKEGDVITSLEKIICYKYLGIETYNTMYKTGNAKQQKCILASRRYRGACRYLSRQGPDVVDMSVCTWKNVAIPAILYGTETIVFSQATIDKLDREQARWAKETLGLHQTCSNTAPQVLMGTPGFKELIYKRQLKYFMRLQELPATRYASQALVENETGGWRSPYLLNIARIQEDLDLVQLPPSIDLVDEIVSSHCLDDLNVKLASLSSIPIIQTGTCLHRARSAREGKEFTWINRAIMGCTGIQYNREQALWRKVCPEDGKPARDLHFVSECAGTARVRKQTGMSLFFTSCEMKGLTREESYSNFLKGLDAKGEQVDLVDFIERGKTLETIFKTNLRD